MPESEQSLSELYQQLHERSCDHVLIFDSGSWRVRRQGAWQTIDPPLSTEALEALARRWEHHASKSPLKIEDFELSVLEHASRRTFCFERAPEARALTLPEALELGLREALEAGESGVILGSPMAPKESLLAQLAALDESGALLYVSHREPPHLERAMLSRPELSAALSTALRVASTVCWERPTGGLALEALYGALDAPRRWATLDAYDPDRALGALGALGHSLTHLIWVEPYYHDGVPPVWLTLRQGVWSSPTQSPLANILVAMANRHLSAHASRRAPQHEAAPSAASVAATSDSTTSSRAAAKPSPDPAPGLIEVELSLSGLSEPRSGDSAAQLERGAATLAALEREDFDGPTVAVHFEREAFLATNAASHDEFDEPPTQLTRLSDLLPLQDDSEPVQLNDILEEQIAGAQSEPVRLDALPADALAVTSSLPEHRERRAPQRAIQKTIPQQEIEPTSEFSRASIMDRYSDLVAAPQDDETSSAPAPYDELKRMERELMIASHDENTGLRSDLLEPAPPPSDDLPIDSEALAELAEHELPSLSWGDEEHTKERRPEAAAPPLNESEGEEAAPRSTTAKLNSLSQRIKALRQRPPPFEETPES